jgi:hypothetical protein
MQTACQREDLARHADSQVTFSSEFEQLRLLIHAHKSHPVLRRRTTFDPVGSRHAQAGCTTSCTPLRNDDTSAVSRTRRADEHTSVDLVAPRSSQPGFALPGFAHSRLRAALPQQASGGCRATRRIGCCTRGNGACRSAGLNVAAHRLPARPPHRCVPGKSVTATS